MDHFYQQKLVNEKNELQKQVAKANKQIAQLSEQVKQYEAVLASMNESYMPNKMASGKEVAELKKRMGQEKYPIPSSIRLRPTPIPTEVKRSPETSEAEKQPLYPKPMSEALVRGMEAIKAKAKLSGKKLPTAAEAAKKMKKIEVEKEMEDAGLGKLKQPRIGNDGY